MNGLCDIFTVFIGISTKPYYVVSYVKDVSVSLKNLTLKSRPFTCSDPNISSACLEAQTLNSPITDTDETSALLESLSASQI